MKLWGERAPSLLGHKEKEKRKEKEILPWSLKLQQEITM
jgi:hypothetical protein